MGQRQRCCLPIGGNGGGGGSNEQRSRSPRRPTKLWKCSITYCWPQMLLPRAVGAERLANSGNLNRSAAPDQTADAAVDYTPFSTRGGQSQCCRGGRQSAGITQAVVGLNAGLMSRTGGADCCDSQRAWSSRAEPSRGMWRASQAPHSDLAAQLARPANSSASEVACKRVLGLRRRAQGLSRRWIPLLCQYLPHELGLISRYSKPHGDAPLPTPAAPPLLTPDLPLRPTAAYCSASLQPNTHHKRLHRTHLCTLRNAATMLIHKSLHRGGQQVAP